MPSSETAPPLGVQRATPLSRATETIRGLRRELEAYRQADRIAIVGIGVRLPGGVDDLESYWQKLARGQHAMQVLPDARRGPFADEWRGLPQRGGFFDDVFGFDAEFFGLSNRQAVGLDPQHRLLLEVTWEALENGGLAPDALAGSPVAVYVGITNNEYRGWNPEVPDAYWAIGSGHSLAAGRVAYTLGLTGPAMAVDTACSSSLVAIHLAMKALRTGECDLAVAGGVNLILAPHTTRLIERTHSLSRDGACKPFDARANGFARSEGCGMVVLKRLPDAVRDGDSVHGVLLGSALNQDGKSSGLTAPNVVAQQRVIATAIVDAGLSPGQLGAVEAHGTGTALGDPIEIEALAAAVGRERDGGDVWVGTAKANFGHTESAAGVVGVIKAVLTLRHREIPPVVNFERLNPRIELAGTSIRIARELTPWRADPGRYNVGVSSFGMSGTNAHAVVGPAPAPSALRPKSGVGGFEISARTPAATCEMARRLLRRLRRLTDDEYAAFAYTVTHGRARHSIRLPVHAATRAQAIAALEHVAATPPEAVEHASAPGDAFSGNGVQRRVVDLPAYPWERVRHVP